MERSGKRVDSGPCGDNWLLTVYFFAITSLCMKCIISIEKKEVSLSSWESRQGNDGEGNLEEKPYIYPVRDRFDIWSIFGFWIYIVVSSSLNRNLSSSTRRIVPGKTDRKFLETDRKRGGGGGERRRRRRGGGRRRTGVRLRANRRNNRGIHLPRVSKAHHPIEGLSLAAAPEVVSERRQSQRNIRAEWRVMG